MSNKYKKAITSAVVGLVANSINHMAKVIKPMKRILTYVERKNNSGNK